LICDTPNEVFKLGLSQPVIYLNQGYLVVVCQHPVSGEVGGHVLGRISPVTPGYTIPYVYLTHGNANDSIRIMVNNVIEKEAQRVRLGDYFDG
jgi:hypothetical protein